MIAALVLIEVVVVVSVLGGGMQNDLTLQRIETNRAFYAAEAGAAMAAREAWLNSDEDGDGSVGGISDDGNTDNNPTVGAASVMVEMTEVSGEIVLIATGRTDRARRRVEIRVE
jgi:Tfp pilus assembly protein PilX